MNHQEAKIILSAYRPGIDDGKDPSIAAALDLARTDATLSRWWERQQAFDTSLQGKLKDIAIPVGLKTNILANCPPPRRSMSWLDYLRQPAWLGAAAGVVVLAGAGVYWLNRPHLVTLAAYQDRMMQFVSAPYKIDHETKDLQQAQHFLAQNNYPADYVLPKSLQSYPLEGACLMKWQGHKVSLLCFGSDEEKKPDVWMMIIPRGETAGGTVAAVPQFSGGGKHPVATWADVRNIYVISMDADEASMRKLL